MTTKSFTDKTSCETWLNSANMSFYYLLSPICSLAQRCTSKELDTQTNVYCIGARYYIRQSLGEVGYDPKTSLWVSTDPILGRYLDRAVSKKENSDNQETTILNSTSLALYTFCKNSPLIIRDFDGNEGFVSSIAFAVAFFPFALMVDVEWNVSRDPDTGIFTSLFTLQYGIGEGAVSAYKSKGFFAGIKGSINNSTDASQMLGQTGVSSVIRGLLGIEGYSAALDDGTMLHGGGYVLGAGIGSVIGVTNVIAIGGEKSKVTIDPKEVALEIKKDLESLSLKNIFKIFKDEK